MTTIVIMPGGFHPFHAGHAALYNSARRAFPDADVYVAATNDTSNRPFPFAIKEKLAKLAGVEPGHFVQVKSPFRAEEITANFDPATDKLIFVRSEKDATKPPQAGGTKKDGNPAYLQPLLGAKKLEPFARHAYMAYLPTVEFGPGMTSATEIRTAWPTLNDKRKTALVMSLYPKTQTNPKLAATVVKMLDTAMSTELNEFAPPGSNDGGDDGFSEETLKMLAAQWYNGNEDPRAERTLMAAGWEIGQDEGYDDEPGVFVIRAGDINGDSYLSWPAHELKQGVAEAQLDESGNEYILYINNKPAAKYTDIRQAEQDLYLVKSKVPTAKFEIKKEVCNMVPVPVGLKEALLKEFAPDEGGESRKFIPWTEFVDQLKQILHKDFDCKESINQDVIKAKFVPYDPMEFGPTQIYSYFERRMGRDKGANSVRGQIQVGKFFKGQSGLMTSYNLLKGTEFERYFDLTFDNLYKIANIIKGNTQGALQMQTAESTNPMTANTSGAGAGMKAGYAQRENQPPMESHTVGYIQEEPDYIEEKWSEKYKRSIDCSHPKGFSQRAHCQGRKK